MGWKASIINPFARKVATTIEKNKLQAVADQNSILQYLLARARETQFGEDHGFADIHDYQAYKQGVPIRDYEGHSVYVEKILTGEKNVLWPDRPKYFAKTSGTTSGAKYIPLTKDSIPNHFGTARNALFNYAQKTGNKGFFEGKMIFLSGSPKLDDKNGIPTGRLSGIVNHMVPKWLRSNQLPSYATNIIEDWEEKLDRIVEETYDQDLRLISGIPPWVKMYFERLLEKTGKDTIKEIFPNFSVFVHGGVNYSPYKKNMEDYMGRGVHTIETYPASEGFIAFQDGLDESGLLLNTHSGIFYEFVPAEEIFKENPTRLKLDEVEIFKNYAVLLSSNAGLWAYNLGDTVEFTSLNPFRLTVTGRIAHYISAFGEHVIAKEVEQAMKKATEEHFCSIVEFTVAPEINPPDQSIAHHEWFIEFEEEPEDLRAFSESLDNTMCEQNIYYRDLIDGSILRPLVVHSLSKDSFISYMKSQGRLGGQNKVPRLSNDTKIASAFKNGTHNSAR